MYVSLSLSWRDMVPGFLRASCSERGHIDTWDNILTKVNITYTSCPNSFFPPSLRVTLCDRTSGLTRTWRHNHRNRNIHNLSRVHIILVVVPLHAYVHSIRPRYFSVDVSANSSQRTVQEKLPVSRTSKSKQVFLDTLSLSMYCHVTNV